MTRILLYHKREKIDYYYLILVKILIMWKIKYETLTRNP